MVVDSCSVFGSLLLGWFEMAFEVTCLRGFGSMSVVSRRLCCGFDYCFCVLMERNYMFICLRRNLFENMSFGFLRKDKTVKNFLKFR